jgi:hypothetical protein
MPSGNDKSGPACNNVENQAQAEPIDSFPCCLNSRIALGTSRYETWKKIQDKICL